MSKFWARLQAWWAGETPSAPGTFLTSEQLAERLTIDSPKLVEELWQITQKQLEAEIGRHTRLETKATGLLTTAGLSLTVAFTFGSTLLTKSEAFARWHLGIVVAFAMTLGVGLLAAIYAVRGVLLRKQLSVSEDAIFEDKALKKSDIVTGQDAETQGLAEYRKGRIIHYWSIRQRYQKTYDEKAALVKVGQHCFLVFLFGLFILCGFVVLAVLWSDAHAKETECPPTSSACERAERAPRTKQAPKNRKKGSRKSGS